jgi:hypothetical protein
VRFWRRSRDREEAWEGLPGVCAPPYTPEYNPKIVLSNSDYRGLVNPLHR